MYFVHASNKFGKESVFEEHKDKTCAIRDAKDLYLEGWNVEMIEGEKIVFDLIEDNRILGRKSLWTRIKSIFGT